jgi:hypothetical protein
MGGEDGAGGHVGVPLSVEDDRRRALANPDPDGRILGKVHDKLVDTFGHP